MMTTYKYKPECPDCSGLIQLVTRSVEYHHVLSLDKKGGIEEGALDLRWQDVHFGNYLFCACCQQDFTTKLEKRP